MANVETIHSELCPAQATGSSQNTDDHGVFLIPELLSEVVSHLHFHDLLRFQRFSRSWNYAIKKNSQAQETIFLRWNKKPKTETVTGQPVLRRSIFREYNPTPAPDKEATLDEIVRSSNMSRDCALSTFLNPWLVQWLDRSGVDETANLTCQYFLPSGYIHGHIRMEVPLEQFKDIVEQEQATWRNMYPARPPSKWVVVYAFQMGPPPERIPLRATPLRVYTESGVTLGEIVSKLKNHTDKKSFPGDSWEIAIRGTLHITWMFDAGYYL